MISYAVSKPRYEEFHNVEYTDEALVSAVELSSKHIHERFLPDKAIDIIDEAGAYKRLGVIPDAEDIKAEGELIADLEQDIDETDYDDIDASLEDDTDNEMSEQAALAKSDDKSQTHTNAQQAD